MNDSEEQIKLFSEASIPRYLPPNGQKTFGPADENESKNNDDHDEIQPLYSVREMVKREEEQVDVMMRQKKKKDKRRIRYVNASDHASESDATDHGNDGDMHRTNDRLQRLQLQHISTIDADDGDGVGSQRNTGSGSTLFIDDTTLNALLRGRALESPDAASIQQEREHQMTKRHRTRRGDLPQDNRRRQGGATPRSARTHRSREGLIGVSPPDMDPDSASISEVGHINQRLALIDSMKGSLADLQPRELGKYTLKRAPLLSAASGSLLGARQHGMAKHFHDGEGNNNENENDGDNSNELNESGFFSARSGVSLGASPHTPHSPTSVASLGSYRSDHSQAAQEEKLKTKADGDLIMKLLQEVRQMPGLFAQAEEQKKVIARMQHQLDEQGAQLEFMKENREVSGRDLSLHAFENRKLLQQIRELQILVRDTKDAKEVTDAENTHIRDKLNATARAQTIQEDEIEKLSLELVALKRVHGACVISANTKHMKQLIEQKDAQVSVLEKERGRLEERLRIKEAAIKAYSASVAHIEQLTVERNRLRAKVAESQANLLIKDDMLAMKFELNRRDRQRQLARDLLCKLIPSLGMEYTQNYTADRRHPAGVKITGLHPGQPADVAGLVPGDVIVQVNNQKTLTKEIFLSVIENSLPGDLLPFHGMRDRGMVSVMVKVGARGFNTRSAQNHIPVVRRLAATTLEDLDLNVEELHVLADRQLGLVSDCESGHARGDGDGGVGDSSASSKSFHKHSNDDSNDNRETGMSASNNDGRTSSMASQDRPRNGAVSTRQVGDKDGKNRMRNNENRDDNNNNNIDSDSGSGSGIKNYRRWKSQSDKSYLYTPVKGQRTKDRSVGGAVRRGRRERSADVAVRKGMRVSRSLSAVGEGRAGREEKRIRGGEGFSSVRKMGHNDLLGKLKLTRSLLMKKKKVRMYSR